MVGIDSADGVEEFGVVALCGGDAGVAQELPRGLGAVLGVNQAAGVLAQLVAFLFPLGEVVGNEGVDRIVADGDAAGGFVGGFHKVVVAGAGI